MSTKELDVAQAVSVCPDVVRKNSLKAYLLSLFILVVGAAMFSCSLLFDEVSPLSLLLMLAGIFVVAYGTYRLMCKCQYSVYIPTGSVLRSKVCRFKPSQLDLLKLVVEKGDEGCDVVQVDHVGGNVRLDALLSDDHRFVALQVLNYESYLFHPVTSVMFYRDEKASRIAEALHLL